MPWVADTHTQTVEVFTAQVTDEIAQTVMAAVPPPPFQPDRTGWQIQLVVDNQDLVQRDLEERRQRTDRLAAAIHIGHGFLQAALVAAYKTACHFAHESPFRAETLLAVPYQFIDKPKPGIMPGGFILGAGIAESDDELNSRHRLAGSALAFGGCLTTFGCCSLSSTTTCVYGDHRQIVSLTARQLNQSPAFRQW